MKQLRPQIIVGTPGRVAELERAWQDAARLHAECWAKRGHAGRPLGVAQCDESARADPPLGSPLRDSERTGAAWKCFRPQYGDDLIFTFFSDPSIIDQGMHP